MTSAAGGWRPPPLPVRAPVHAPPEPDSIYPLKPWHWALGFSLLVAAGIALGWPSLQNQMLNALPGETAVREMVEARVRASLGGGDATAIEVVVGPMKWEGLGKASCSAGVTAALRADLFEEVDFAALVREAGDDAGACDRAVELWSALPESLRPPKPAVEARGVVRRTAVLGSRQEWQIPVQAQRVGREWAVSLGESGDRGPTGFSGRGLDSWNPRPLILGTPEAGAAIRNYVEGRRRFVVLVGQAGAESAERAAEDLRGREERERLEIVRVQEERRLAEAKRQEEEQQRLAQEKQLSEQKAHEAESARKRAEEDRRRRLAGPWAGTVTFGSHLTGTTALSFEFRLDLQGGRAIGSVVGGGATQSSVGSYALRRSGDAYTWVLDDAGPGITSTFELRPSADLTTASVSVVYARYGRAVTTGQGRFVNRAPLNAPASHRGGGTTPPSGPRRVHAIPQLKTLVGQRLGNDWVYGKFGVLQITDVSARLQTVGETTMIAALLLGTRERTYAYGSTAVTVTIKSGATFPNQGKLVEFTQAAPLRILSVKQDQDGRLTVEAEY